MVAKKIDKRLSESYKIHLLVSKGWDKNFNLAKMSIRWVHSKTFWRVLAFSKIREKKKENFPCLQFRGVLKAILDWPSCVF